MKALLAGIFALILSVTHIFAGGGHISSPNSAAVASAIPAIATTTSTTLPQIPVDAPVLTTNQKGTMIYHSASNTASTGQVLGVSTETPSSITYTGVTEDELTAKLTDLQNRLTNLIETNTAGTVGKGYYSTGGFTNSIALSNKIDQLSGTRLSNITVSGVSGLTTNDIPALNYLSLASGTSTARSNLGLAYANNNDAAYPSYNIVTWGDSITQGNADGSGVTYPAAMSADLGGRTVYNEGISGNTSTQVETRMVSDTLKHSWTVVIWAGYNNYTNGAQVESDIAAMVASLGSNTHYVVLSILNGSTETSGSSGYNQILAINNYLASTYSGHYLDIRAYLVSQYNSSLSQDVTDHSNDIVPNSLRFDHIHPNAAGDYLVAQQVANFITTNLDPLATTSGVLTVANLPSIFANPLSFGGFINTSGTTGGYQIDNYTILYASSTNASTLVGNGAGASLLSSGLNNTAVGYQALYTATSSGNNTAVGYQALYLNTSGTFNNAQGLGALLNNTTGSYNNAVGGYALQRNTSGVDNTAIGASALSFNNTGSDNTAIGFNALFNATSSNSNTAVGSASLYYNTSGGFNTAMGQYALQTNVTGANNVAIGYSALGNNNSSTSSVAVGTQAGKGGSGAYHNQGSALLGYQAGNSFINGSDYNTIIGYQTGYGVTSGADNVLIGASIHSSSYSQITTGSQNISIGYDIAVPSPTTNGQLNIGNIIYGTGNTGTQSTVSSGNIGIGTTTPWAKLSIAGVAGGTTPLFTISTSTSSFATSTVLIVDRNGQVGIATSSPWRNFSVNGTVSLAGLTTDSADTKVLCLTANNEVVANAGTSCITSSQRFKNTIVPLATSSGVDEILQLNPVSFQYNSDIGIPGTQVGFIAEQVNTIDPRLVVLDASSSPFTVKYENLTAILAKAIQDIATISGTFKDNLVAWLGSATNGLRKVSADQLCARKSDGSEVCVTGDQLSNILSSSGQTVVVVSAPTPIVVSDSSGTTTPTIENTEAPTTTPDTADDTATTTAQ